MSYQNKISLPTNLDSGFDSACPTMNLERIDGEWWIVATPEGVEHMGPYDSRTEAAEDLAGLKRFLKGQDDDPSR